LGARFEGQSPDWIASRFPTRQALIEHPPGDELWYTDDTQMTIGVAETLAEQGEILEDRLCQAFVSNYVPSRGYGRGTRVVIEAIEDGRDYRRVAESYFQGGSYGNGAAMRVAPVGLVFRDDLRKTRDQARTSAVPTHTHPLGIEGAQLLAVAVALASHAEAADLEKFFSPLLDSCNTREFRAKMTLASRVGTVADLAAIGNGIEATESVPTAIACFTLTPERYEDVIANAIFLGGDTDTIAAMAGALAGCYNGLAGIPAHLVAILEDHQKGRSYLQQLATRLWETYQARKVDRK
jgi:poly(ADP-ribose) glycohydrolase ARH3